MRMRPPLRLLLLALLSMSGCAAPDEGASIVTRSESIGRGNLQEIISLTGTLEAQSRAGLPFLQSGVLLEQFASEGDRVRQGDLLLKLDISQLELDLRDAQLTVQLQQIALEELRTGPTQYDIAAATAAVARAQAQLNQTSHPPSQEAVRIAQANLDIARSNYWVALNERDSISEAHPGGQELQSAEMNIGANELAMNIALQDLANVQQGTGTEEIGIAQASVYQAQASLNRLLEGASEYDLQIAELQIRLAEIAMENAYSSLEDAEIHAPFDGVVTQISVVIGEQVTPGMPVATVIDDSQFIIDVIVDELDIPRLREGQLAFIALDAFSEEKINAHLVKIAPDAVNILGIASYDVRLIVEPVDLPVRDGMTATVEIIVAELTDVILVPNWAIRFDRETGLAYAAVQDDAGTISEIEIQIGTRGEDYSEVLEGLTPGQVVVLVQQDSFSVFGAE